MSNFKTKLVMPQEAVWLLPKVMHLLHAANSEGHGETPLHEHVRRIMAYEAHLWIFYNEQNEILGIGVTRFIDYTTHRTLQLVLCAGIKWEEWATQYYIVEQFAKDSNCIAVEAWGRRGWARLLPKHLPGFEEAYVVMRKNI
jgi:hypothetical protein